MGARCPATADRLGRYDPGLDRSGGPVVTQDLLRNVGSGAPSISEGSAAGATQAVAIERLLLAALPPGWSLIGRCRFGTALPGPDPTGCHALAHPEIGIALIDIAPDATPNAESRLRRALSAADFWSDFPGYLPVWHGRLEGPAIRGLARIVQDRFSSLPALTVPGGQAWIGAVRRAVAQDPAWAVPGQAARPAVPPPPPEPEEEPADEEPRRRWPHALLLLGFLGTFGLGLATGLLLLPQPEPVPPAAPPPSAEPAGVLAPLPPTPAAAAEPVAQPPVDSPAPATAIPAMEAEPAPAPWLESIATPEASAMVATPPAAEPEPEAPAGTEALPIEPDGEEPSASVGMPEEPRPPLVPPPEPPPPAPRRAAEAPSRPGRSASGMDRACIQALFRFQQGETLSAAEQVHLRNGCTTRR